MRVGFLGMGIVGTATALAFEKVHQLFSYDKYKEGYLTLKEVANNAEVIFLCLPTPMRPSGEIDLTSIYESVGNLNELLGPKDETVMVIRSTAVSGSTNWLGKMFPRRKFAVNPEFLTEKNAEADFLKSERIVIGAEEDAVFEKVKQVYVEAGFHCPIIKTTFKEAEFLKYLSNSFLATKVSFANEMYEIAQTLDIDYDRVKELLLLDSRIGKSHLNVPGPDGLDPRGFGGRCLPKDLNALIYLAREHHVRPYLLEEVWRTNLKYRKNRDWEKP